MPTQNIDFNLQPHQQRLVDKLLNENQPGLVASHSTGSGKSLASLAAYKALGLPTTVVAPAALKKNYEKEMQKWLGKHPEDIKLVSQELVARQGLGNYDSPGGLLVVDEAQRSRTRENRLQQELAKTQAKKRLLLSGTPVVNNPHDMANLINLAAGKEVLPKDKIEFEKQYTGTKQVPLTWWQKFRGFTPGEVPTLKNTEELKKVLNQYVDFHPASKEQYPAVTEEVHKIPMGQKQTDLYNTLMHKADWITRMKIKYNLPANKAELDRMRFFLTGPRQASDSNLEYITNKKNLESAKAQAAFDYFKEQNKKDPSYKAVVYSNYLNSGVEPYRQLLEKSKIPHGVFTGDIPDKLRNEMVKLYNADKIKALLISSAGAEGLDLRGTRLVQLLEPHWQQAREKQVIGRAARYKSHAALPPEKQNVLVQRYLAEPKAGRLAQLFGTKTRRGTDEYIYNLAQQKEQLNKQVEQLLAQEQLKNYE
jgi:SNF2 family DNA or RNA helicase